MLVGKEVKSIKILENRAQNAGKEVATKYSGLILVCTKITQGGLGIWTLESGTESM